MMRPMVGATWLQGEPSCAVVETDERIFTKRQLPQRLFLFTGVEPNDKKFLQVIQKNQE
jgi:hypothetical protein